MTANNTCIACIQNQIKQICDMLKINNKEHIMQSLQQDIESYTQGAVPPQIAMNVYSNFSKSTGINDPFWHIKQNSILKARRIVDEILRDYPPPTMDKKDADSIYKQLNWALRIAIMGNVIDYGSQSKFDFNIESFNPKNADYHFCIRPFMQKLDSAKNLLYLADNAGENIFDEVLLKTLKTIYPSLEIYYAVRGKPIINDLTINDMQHPLARSIQNYCTLLDSGVGSPGFIYEYANAKTQEIYNLADIILSKGMGNFECLNAQKDERLFMLFKVKCDVVATFCGVEKGAMMFMHNV